MSRKVRYRIILQPSALQHSLLSKRRIYAPSADLTAYNREERTKRRLMPSEVLIQSVSALRRTPDGKEAREYI